MKKKIKKRLLYLLLFVFGITTVFLVRKPLVLYGLKHENDSIRGLSESFFVYKLDESCALEILDEIFNSDDLKLKKQCIILTSLKLKHLYIGKISSRFISILAPYLNKENAEIQRELIHFFAIADSTQLDKKERAVLLANLFKLFEEKDVFFKVFLFPCMGNIGNESEEVTELLLKYIDYKEVQTSCIEGLGKQGQFAKKTIPKLESFLESKSIYTKYVASKALLKIEPEHKKANTIYQECKKSQNVWIILDEALEEPINLEFTSRSLGDVVKDSGNLLANGISSICEFARDTFFNTILWF